MTQPSNALGPVWVERVVASVAWINEDLVRHELGAIAFTRVDLIEYLKSAHVHKLLNATCSNHVESVWAEVSHLAEAFIPKPLCFKLHTCGFPR